MRLSDHFTLSEMHGENAPADVVERLRRLADLLETCRRVWGDRPVVVTSGYRDPASNERANGSRGSQHLVGEAADLHVPGLTAREAMRLLYASPVCVGQAIVYGLGRDGSGPGTFLHISLPAPSRGLWQDYLWTEAPGGSSGPYHPWRQT